MVGSSVQLHPGVTGTPDVTAPLNLRGVDMLQMAAPRLVPQDLGRDDSHGLSCSSRSPRGRTALETFGGFY